jgi:hypothetical protein
MQFIPADAYQYLHMMSGLGMTISGSGMEDYAGYVNTYTQQMANTGTPVATGSPTHFYLVLAFPQGDFADKLDIHEEHDMLVPASGTIAPILGVFRDEKIATSKMDADTERVHLMYKLRIKGADDLKKFLDFMAENDMMESIGGK